MIAKDSYNSQPTQNAPLKNIPRMKSDMEYKGTYAYGAERFFASSHYAYDDGDHLTGRDLKSYEHWVDYEDTYIAMNLLGLQGTNCGMTGDERAHIFDSDDDNHGDEHHLRHDEHKEILDYLSDLVKGMVSHSYCRVHPGSFFNGEWDASPPMSTGILHLTQDARFAKTCECLNMAIEGFIEFGFDSFNSVDRYYTPLSSPVPLSPVSMIGDYPPSVSMSEDPQSSVPRAKADHVSLFLEAAAQTAQAIEKLGNDRSKEYKFAETLKTTVGLGDKLVQMLLAVMGSDVLDLTSQPLEVSKRRAVSKMTVCALRDEWKCRILPRAVHMFKDPDAELTSGEVAEILGYMLGFVVVLCCRAESAVAGMMLLARNFVGIMRKSPAQHYATDSEACLVCTHTDLIWMYFITGKSKEGFKVMRRHLNSRTVPPPFPCLNLERCLYLSDEQRARTVDMFREAIFRMGGPEVVQEPLDISLASISHEQDPRNIRRVVNIVLAAHVLGPSLETGYDKLNRRDKTFLYDSPLFAPAKIMIQHLSRFAKEFAMQTILMDNFLRELSETDLFQALEKGLHGADTYVRGGTNGRLKTFFKGVYLDIFDNFKPCPHRGMEHTRLALQGRLVILLHELWLTMDNDNHAFDWGNCDLLKDAGKDGPFWSRVLEGIDPSKFFIIDTPENTPVIPFNGSFKVTYGDVSFPLNTCSHCYMPGMPTCKKTTTYHLSNHTDRHLFALHFHNHILTVYVNDMWCSGPGECIRGATAHQPARMYTALAAKDG
jgi:hypothetical protein